MQVNVVSGGRDAFNALLYSTPNNSTLNWLNNNINRAREALTGVADHLVDATVNLYNKVNSDGMINAAKALVATHGSHTNEYMIYSVSPEHLGEANYIMQQYIMCNPKVQELYVDNLCYGFEETYYDPEPDLHGEDRDDYRRVMDGVVQFEGDDAYIMHYSSCDETEISTADKFAILETWQHVENLILCGKDPTDPEMGEL